MSRDLVIAGTLAVALLLSYEVRLLKDQNQAILSELGAVHELVETAAAPRVALSTEMIAFLGRPDAPLTMVEFTDLECPFCRLFHATTFRQIKADYIDTGKLRFASLDFPLDAIHPLAVVGARAARCAGEQGQWWEMRDRIFGAAKLQLVTFAGLARDLRLDEGRFTECMADTRRIDTMWLKDKAAGSIIGVSGTPSFVIGQTAAGGVEGIRLVGAKPYNVFDAKFRELLRNSSISR